MQGLFHVDIVRNGAIVDSFEVKNGITNAGLDKLLNVMFDNATQIANWYIGLIDNASYTALAAADTHASHAGWIENTQYDESTRPEWSPDAASSQSIANATARSFTMSATAAIKGFFIASSNVKGSTSGSVTLWSTAAFSAVRNVADGDTINITYILGAALA
jgi:hypothetical protein